LGNLVIFVDMLERIVAAASGWKYPPPGVPVEADPARDYLPLSAAAQRVGVDRRTLLAAVVRGDTAGWARPGPGNLRWFVYEDSLPLARDDDAAGRLKRLEAENERLRAQISDAQTSRAGGISDSAESVIADLRARLVMAEEANLLLIAAHADLAAAADKYRQALAQYMTPGHIGELTQRG
jgi:hypothetical protein